MQQRKVKKKTKTKTKQSNLKKSKRIPNQMSHHHGTLVGGNGAYMKYPWPSENLPSHIILSKLLYSFKMLSKNNYGLFFQVLIWRSLFRFVYIVRLS